MAAPFKKTTIKQFPRVSEKITRDTLYWKKFEFPVTRKEFGPINHVEFSPVAPYNFAVTAAARVQVLSPETDQPIKVFSRFRESTRCGSFRQDGRLLVAGSDDGSIKLFDIKGKALLRVFKPYLPQKKSTRVTKFLHDNKRIMSGSDDKIVRIWDIASEKELSKYSEHQDYIRCGVASQASSDIIITGSYDHTVKMFDTRTNGSVLSVHHGQPVESVLLYPSGGIFLSAGGNVVKVWDALAGGRLLTTFSNHHKTIMSLSFASNYQRILSAALDRHVKIYDTSTYQVVHTLDYPSAILTVASSPDDSMLVVGMADGLVSIQHRKPEERQTNAQVKKQLKKASYRYAMKTHTPAQNDFVVEHKRKEVLKNYDKYFKKFQHSKALDAALVYTVRGKTPEVTISVLQELIRRSAIKQAIAARDEASLSGLIKFIQKNLSNPQYMSILIDVANIILDLYSEKIGESDAIAESLRRLQSTVEDELQYQKQLMELLGTMDTLFSVAESSLNSTAQLSSDSKSLNVSSAPVEQSALKPSQAALAEVS